MKTTVVIDNNNEVRGNLSTLINKHCVFAQVIGYSSNVMKGIAMVESLKPEIVFATHSDFSMDKVNQLFSSPNTTRHIFLNQSIDGERLVDKVSYLQIPYDINTVLPLVNKVLYKLKEDDLRNRVNRLMTRGAALNKIALSTTEGLMFVNHNDIVQVKADRGYSYINLLSGKELFITKPIKQLEAMLSSQTFFRSHKSYLLNVNHLKSYKNQDGGYALMSNGVQVPVSRRKKTNFLNMMRNFSNLQAG